MIRHRALTVLFPNGFTATVHLPGISQEVPEVDSAAQIVTSLEKYRNGLQRLIARSPSLTMGKGKVYSNVDEVLHTIVNARKYLDMNRVDLDYMHEHYHLDLITQTITFHNMSIGEERGSMPLKMFYANWREMFYPETVSEESVVGLSEWLYDVYETGERIIATEIPSTSEDVKSDMRSVVEDTIKHLEDADLEDLDDDKSIGELLDDPDLGHKRKRHEHLTRYAEKMKEVIEDHDYELWEKSIEVLADYEDEEKLDLDLDNIFIRINYSGGGDSGSVDDIQVFTHDHKIISTISGDSREELEEIAWRVIDTEESGFYNNDGGYGYFIIGPQKYTWKHYNYVSSEEQSVDYQRTVE